MHVNILSKLRLIFCWCQQKIQKMSYFLYFNDHNPGRIHDNQINDPIFFIYSLSSICWYISFLHFKTSKIQFHGVPPLHFVLVCKIPIYMPKMTSPLTQISFFYIKFANFWYIICFVPYLIPIWPRSHGLSIWLSLHFLLIISGNYFFVFLCFMCFLSVLSFQFDVIFIYIYGTSPAFQTSYPLKKRCSISPAFVLSHPP